MSVQHQPSAHRFTIKEAGHTSELVYELLAPGVIDFVHTYVDEATRGQGLADELARAGLAYARQQRLQVRTSCKFMAGFAERHRAEYADILAA